MLYKIILSLFILLNVTLLSISSKEMTLSDVALHRSKRQLLYPNSTILQFNVGLGLPSVVKNVNVNYAFQANFQLPWNRTQIPVDILYANSGYTGNSKKKRALEEIKDDNGYGDDAKLHHFYRHVEDVLDSFGYKGRPCVLKTLCQLGAEPLHSDDEEDLLRDMISFVLNPTNDALHLTERDEAYPYIKAYKDGQNHKDCAKLYQGCCISLIDLFTRLHGELTLS